MQFAWRQAKGGVECGNLLGRRRGRLLATVCADVKYLFKMAENDYNYPVPKRSTANTRLAKFW